MNVSGRSYAVMAVLLIAASSSSAQGRASNTHDCHVYAINVEQGEKLIREFLERPDAKPDEFKALAEKAEKILGKFKADVGEEVTTTKSFPLPGTGLIVTATVFYTDEAMGLADSMMEGLAIGKGPVENALEAPGASVVEVNLEKDTYKLRAKQRVVVNGKAWIVGLECQCMSDDDRRKQKNLPPVKP